MIQAILLLPKRGRHPQESQHISDVEISKQPHMIQRAARVKILKHEVFRRGRMLDCSRCRQFCESTSSSLISSEGVCPGPRMYGPPQRDRPWNIPTYRGPIWWGRSKLHKSHRAAWYKGVLKCSQCGQFSSKGQSLRGLAKPCHVNPKGRYFQMTMGLMRHGTPRAGFKGWPSEDNVPGKEEAHIAAIV